MIGIIEKKILTTILNSQTNIFNLAENFNLSERSIRYKIKNLNEFFKEENIQGNILIKQGNINFIGEADIFDNKNFTLKSTNYIFSQEERIEYLKVLILFSNKKINFKEAAEKLDISFSTFKKDLKILKQDFQDLGIQIKNTKYTTEILCDEDTLRRILLKYTLKNSSDSEKFKEGTTLINKVINKYFEGFDFTIIINFFNDISSKLDKVISDEAFEILKDYLAIAILRNKNNNFSFSNIKNKNFLMNTEEFIVLSKKLKLIEEKYNLIFQEEETYILTEYLLGSHSYNLKYSFYDNWVRVEGVIISIIENVGKNLNINFSEDSQLFEGLLNHIIPMIYRIKKGLKLENSIVDNIQTEEITIFSAVKESLKTLEDFIEKKIDDDEIVYLVIFFKLSIQRIQRKLKKKIIIVCSFGYGISKILEVSLKEKFNIEIIDTLPLNKLNDYPLKNKKIDLIITTVNINKNLDKIPTPIIKVSPLLNKENLLKLEEAGLQKISIDIKIEVLLKIIQENCIIENNSILRSEIYKLFGLKEVEKIQDKDLSQYLPINNIRIIDKADDWESAIKQAGQILVDNGYVNNAYVEESIDIIKEQGPYMLLGKSILLPHSSNLKNIIKTGYSYLKLKQPVIIKDEDEEIMIKNIFFLASLNGKEHRHSLIILKKIIDECNLALVLKTETTPEEIYRKIVQLEGFIKNK